MRNIGEWIKVHTDTVNLLMPACLGDPMLSLLGSFLHVRGNSVFEGKADN